MFQTTNQYYRIAMTCHDSTPFSITHPCWSPIFKRLQLLLIINLEVSKFGKARDFRNPIPSDITTGIDHQTLRLDHHKELLSDMFGIMHKDIIQKLRFNFKPSRMGVYCGFNSQYNALNALNVGPENQQILD